MNNKIIIINGPNLNLLGEREQSQYGSITFDQLNKQCLDKGKELNINLEFYQSNIEGEIINYIQEAKNKFDVGTDPNWNNSNNQPGKHVFEGNKNKDYDGMSMVMLKKPDKKYKMKAYFIIFDNYDGVNKVARIDVSPWEDIGNKVVCKKRATTMYMEYYNSGKYQITDQEHADNKKFPDKIIRFQKSFKNGNNVRLQYQISDYRKLPTVPAKIKKKGQFILRKEGKKK